MPPSSRRHATQQRRAFRAVADAGNATESRVRLFSHAVVVLDCAVDDMVVSHPRGVAACVRKVGLACGGRLHGGLQQRSRCRVVPKDDAPRGTSIKAMDRMDVAPQLIAHRLHQDGVTFFREAIFVDHHAGGLCYNAPSIRLLENADWEWWQGCVQSVWPPRCAAHRRREHIG